MRAQSETVPATRISSILNDQISVVLKEHCRQNGPFLRTKMLKRASPLIPEPHAILPKPQHLLAGRASPKGGCARPYTLYPAPCTRHPTPSPYTLHPATCTLHPSPYSLHPAPYTLGKTHNFYSTHISCVEQGTTGCRSQLAAHLQYPNTLRDDRALVKCVTASKEEETTCTGCGLSLESQCQNRAVTDLNVAMLLASGLG